MQTYITLNDGTNIPQFGLGVYLVLSSPDDTDYAQEHSQLVSCS